MLDKLRVFLRSHCEKKLTKKVDITISFFLKKIVFYYFLKKKKKVMYFFRFFVIF